MTNNKQLLLMGTAFAAMAFITHVAFAGGDNINGVGNTINDVNGIGNNVGNVGSNSNNPITANGGSASNHTNVDTDVKNSISNRSDQAQHQSQGQGQSQSISHSGNSSSYSKGGSVKDSGNSSAAGGSANGSGNSSNSYLSEAQKRNPVSTAFAAPLVAADDTCMGSSSVGGQAVGFGASFGSTWRDNDCVRRKDARELHNMGQKAAALALMCQNENIAAAMATAGTPCLGAARKEATDATVLGKLSPASEKKAKVSKADDGVVYEYPTSAKRVNW